MTNSVIKQKTLGLNVLYEAGKERVAIQVGEKFKKCAPGSLNALGKKNDGLSQGNISGSSPSRKSLGNFGKVVSSAHGCTEKPSHTIG